MCQRDTRQEHKREFLPCSNTRFYWRKETCGHHKFRHFCMKWLQEWLIFQGLEDVRAKRSLRTRVVEEASYRGGTLSRCLRIKRERRKNPSRQRAVLILPLSIAHLYPLLSIPHCALPWSESPASLTWTQQKPPYLDTAKASPADLPPPCLVVHESILKFNCQKLQTYQKYSKQCKSHKIPTLLTQ